ncbi:MAG: ATP-binding protein [Chloroflexota bacterium]
MSDTGFTSGFPGLAGAGDAIARAMWNGPSPIVVVEGDGGRVVAVNDAMAALLGHSRDDLVGRESADLAVWPGAGEQQRLHSLFRGGEDQRDVPVRMRRRSGETLEAIAAVSRVEIGGRPCAVICLADVTERRRLESDAATERGRLDLVADALPTGVVTMGMDGVIISSNRSARDLLGLSADQIAGRTLFDPRWRLVRQDGSPLPPGETPSMLALRTGEAHEGVTGIHRPDGSLVWLAGTSRVVRGGGPGGAPVVVSAFVDVSALEEARQDLEHARDAAQEADRAKSRFLSVISHELRTPLTAVMGYSQMLLAEAGGPLTPSQRHDLVQVARGADRLLSLIEDLLELGRIQTRQLALEPEPVDLSALLRDLEPDLRVQATAGGLSLWLLAEPGLTVVGDARRLEQVFLNLVGNAVKFTPEGQVRVDAVRDGADALVTVEDTGIGIEAGEQERIFDLFLQGDAGAARRYGGLGIGLAIAKRVVERHRGTISVRSAPGEGATFSVRLPLLG